MRKTSAIIFVLALSLFAIKLANAETYGPPAGYDMSQIPAGVNIPSGAPANMGPSAEQLQRMNSAGDMEAKGAAMQAAGEAKEKAALEAAFKRMSGNISKFEKGVAIIKTQVKKLNDKGAPTTPAMQAELDKLDAFLVSLKAATTIEELEPLFEKFGDLVDGAQEQLQIMSKASKWPSIEKQAANLIAKLEKESVNLKARADKKGLKDDLTENFTELDAKIADQKTKLEALKVQVKTDPDAVFDNIGEYFDGFRAIYEDNVQGIASSLDLKKAVKTEFPKIITAMEKRIAALDKKSKGKISTTELKAIVVSAKAKLAEIKTMTAGKITDMDAVINSIDELTNFSTQFEDKFEALTGSDVNPYEPTKLLQGDQKDYKINLPAGLPALMK